MASIQRKCIVIRVACAILCFICITLQRSQAQPCIATGPNSPGTAVSTGSGIAFSDPTNVLASDNNRAVAAPLVVLLNGQTENLQASNFGFSIPLTAIICGIEVEVEKSATNIGTVLFLTTVVTDRSVQLLKNGTPVGSDLANPANWTTSEAILSYGGANELWGTTWMPADINAADFGISFSASIFDLASLLPRVRLDHIRITVYYYEPPLLSFAFRQFSVSHGHNSSALLQWKGGEQHESMHFSIQRSADNIIWEHVPGVPLWDTVREQYSFTDVNPRPGRSYYRLAMNHPSGEIKYSVSQSLVMPEKPIVHCYPNPFSSSIQLTGVQAGERVLLTDVFGKRRTLPPRQVISHGNIVLDLHHLQPGVYFVQVGNSRKKILKL